MTLSELAKSMAEIDFAMLVTRSADDCLTARPMSNNGDVEYDGDSFYFSYGATGKVADIRGTAAVGLTFQGVADGSGRPPLFVSVSGEAELIADRARFAQHWVADLDRWFPEGIDTPDMVLIKVRARYIRYWGENEGSLEV